MLEPGWRLGTSRWRLTALEHSPSRRPGRSRSGQAVMSCHGTPYGKRDAREGGDRRGHLAFGLAEDLAQTLGLLGRQEPFALALLVAHVVMQLGDVLAFHLGDPHLADRGIDDEIYRPRYSR